MTYKCSFHVLGCRAAATKQHDGWAVCDHHYRLGMRWIKKLEREATLRKMLRGLGIVSEPVITMRLIWKGPYYRLEDTRPWQDNAIRAWEDNDV